MKDLLTQFKDRHATMTQKELETRGAVLISLGIPFISLALLFRGNGLVSMLLWGLGLLIFLFGVIYLAQLEDAVKKDD